MRVHSTLVPDSPPHSASSARAYAVPIGAHVVPSDIEGNCYFHHSHAEGCRPLRREAAWVATYVPLRYEWGNGIVAGLGHRPILHTKQALFTSRQQKHGGASKFFGTMFTMCKHSPRPCCRQVPSSLSLSYHAAAIGARPPLARVATACNKKGWR